jgi:hypothetical protein
VVPLLWLPQAPSSKSLRLALAAMQLRMPDAKVARLNVALAKDIVARHAVIAATFGHATSRIFIIQSRIDYASA